MKRKLSSPVFKHYATGQTVLLPTDLNDLIPANHLVRVIASYIDKMDLTLVEKRYKGGGASSYHPRMMLKVLVYAYTQKTYSSRRIAKALRENVAFMWLSGLSTPDFHTVNRFRGVILKGLIHDIFFEVVKLLMNEGYIKYEDLFVDGTKVEANANRYKAVWAKNTERYENGLREKVHQLLSEIEAVNQEEEERYGDQDLEEVGGETPIDPEKMTQSVDTLNQRLRDMTDTTTPEPEHADEPLVPDLPLVEEIEQKLEQLESQLAVQPQNKQLKRAVRLLKGDYLERARRYAEQRGNLSGRNSYAKTDLDATYMRMKEDQNNPHGRPKAAYNIQNATENQFIINFSIHQQAGDCNCFVPHMDQLKARIGRFPNKVNADAAYGIEENYTYLERHGLANYLKYPGFDRQQKPRYQPDPFKGENMPYDPDTDTFTCPNGRLLTFRSLETVVSKTGFESERRIYECVSCEGCPLKEQCTKSEGNRRTAANFEYWRYRAQAKKNLETEEGQRLRKQRGPDVETPYGRIKQDWGFRRFMLRGNEKVSVEWGLLSIAHDLSKVWTSENGKRLVSA